MAGVDKFGNAIPDPQKSAVQTPEELQAQSNAFSIKNQQLQSQQAYYDNLVNSMKEAEKAGPELQYNPMQTGPDGKASLKDEFKLQKSDSYLNQVLQKQGMGEAAGRDQAALQSQAALNNANSGLSMRGGLNSANRANLARSSMRDSLIAQQGVARAGMTDRNNVNIEGAKMDQGIDEKNLNNMLQSAGAVNEFNLNKYNQQMAVKAADKSAAETRAASANQGKK